MKKVLFFSSIMIFISIELFPQQKLEDDIEIAFQNAKKGIYWALSNIPEKKTRLDNSLIGEDILLANVKLSKEINGVRVESIGYYHSNEVRIILFQSNESLKKGGYISTSSAASDQEID